MRRFISESEREQIVGMRKSGASWLKIQQETNVDRRTAQNIFAQYKKEQSGEEIAAARRQVAADLFRSHIHDLIAMGNALSNALHDPDFRDLRDGDGVINTTLSDPIREKTVTDQNLFTSTDMIRKQNFRLLDSLKQHTADKIDWRSLDTWCVARDNWQGGREELRSTSVELIRNFLKLDSDKPGPAALIYADKNLMSTMSEGVVEAVFYALAANRLDEIKKYINAKDHEGKVVVLFGGSSSITNMTVQSRPAADKIVEICRRVTTNLREGMESNALAKLQNALSVMRESRDSLVENLDELIITPLILRSKCDICPA